MTNQKSSMRVARGWFAVALATIMGATALAVAIPANVKRIVTFVFVKRPNGELAPNGTGFFVGVKDKKRPERSFVYFVTARHVMRSNDHTNCEPNWEHQQAC